MKSEPFVFHGSLMEGPDIDLIEIAGLTLTPSELDRLWESVSPIELVRECPSVDEIVTHETDEWPGMSDVFYEYTASSKEAFAKELREAIQAGISRDGKH